MNQQPTFAISRRTLLGSAAGLCFAANAESPKPGEVVRSLNATDLAWLAQANDVGLKVLASYVRTSEVTPKNLDTAFANWKGDGTSQRAPAKDVAQGLGVLFGNLVVRRKKAEWAVVTDSYGTEIAVRSAAGGELFPVNTVWKRVDPKNLDMKFFEPIWTLVVEKEFVAR